MAIKRGGGYGKILVSNSHKNQENDQFTKRPSRKIIIHDKLEVSI